ncbi:MAG: VOC family protein [Acetobacteraceae bacterium]|nr:VOC family protein [Acetobacteraceae bacterium]MBV8523823.1 VOC family protein [Acetobacteraceae bacterium]MBV8590418.1 VOC family protein [Acetobacteraceae bacterium]
MQPESPPLPRLSGVLETSLYVADLDRSEAFYQHLFGFEIFLRDGRMCALGVPGGHVLLLFRHGGSAQPSPAPGGFIPAHDGQGRLHLCFSIPVGSLGDWESRLEEGGVAIESRITWPRGGTSLYFRDPDGHSLELASPGLWPNY